MDQEDKNTSEELDSSKEKPAKTTNRRLLKYAAVLFGMVLLAGLAYAGYAYASSPPVIREPKLDHYHFRMQILVDGKAENFADDKYQQDYAKNQCSIDLPTQPIHMHDKKDQFVHIHWQGITGGMVFKNYGWNYIGGINNALGYKADGITDVHKVAIHGNVLPPVPQDASFYIYTGDESGYKEQNFDSWLKEDLETFFGKESNFAMTDPATKKSILDVLFPKAYAHEGEDHSATDSTDSTETEEEKLARINNLIGNVVIFVQKDKPSDAQITERFHSLAPLTESTCGG